MQKRTININLKNIEKVSKNKEFYADFNSGEKIFQQKNYGSTNCMIMNENFFSFIWNAFFKVNF